MKKHIIISITGVSLALSAAAVFAEKPTSALSGKAHTGYFARYDSNQDNIITAEEFSASAVERFKKMDGKDSDGKVTAQEYKDYSADRRRARRRGERFTEMDADKDGKISAEEYKTASSKRSDEMFAKMDKDSDQSISSEEHAGYRYDMGSRSKSSRSNYSAKDAFANMDADKDGSVTLQEYQASRNEWFGKMDKDGDKSVTAEEIEAMMAERKAKSKQK